MSWEKVQPYLDQIDAGCVNCGGTHRIASLQSVIATGFGSAFITKDGDQIFEEQDAMDPNGPWEDIPLLQHFEDMAKQDPDHDWRFHYHGPMRDAVHQRQSDGEWVLIEVGVGFA